ncbi:centromere protein F isoform X2 [Scomber scombrus]|uniref:centromere protein F isoform X2 n=1 Tax=Scomber scombrus TaxID=13677 RepID=UPI002DD8E7C8|nr:centromere protein F isoform X2 [Scomber scombrus]
MSWAEDDWTVGLSGRVLQKVKELQVQQERLSRENKQKQLQLDNINTSLEKQTVKYEEVRGELQSVHRELQSVRDEAKVAATSSQRLSQELQTKQAQVCSLEGQLDASRSVNNKLTQEVKRLETELEKLQNSSRSADTPLFSTPCWNTTSPWENNGSRKEDRLGQRDEGHIRRLQFSDMPTASLPRQQHKITPHRHLSDQSESYSTPMAAFPWERDDSRSAARRRSPTSPQTPVVDLSQAHSEQRVCGKEKNQTQTDTSSSEMRSRVSSLEEELRVKAEKLKSTQNEMVQSKKELASRDVSLQRSRDELSLAHTRMAQESEKASKAEQRLKQLQEELKCQRQNAESSRLQHQQRTKELEKQNQRDLLELQKERQCLERQHQQEVNKLNQELQQARTLHNALQAQADKLSLQKQALDKELETLKEKLKWTEGQLQESQKKEAQTQAKLTEAVREAEGVAVRLEQSRKREQALEEEGRRLAEERADALHLLKELQEQKAAPVPLQPVQYCCGGQSFSTQPSFSHQSRSSPYTKRSATSRAEQRRDKGPDEECEGKAEIAASYPIDREPGEGIDSEHITVFISPDSECLQRGQHRRGSDDEENKSRNQPTECDTSWTNRPSSFDEVLCRSSQSASVTPTMTSIDDSADKTRHLKAEQATPSKDLQRENAMLRSELHDVREELQKRLEDLEAQRRAESETKTRLKQLSRKHASQGVEKEEQEKEWKSQLEREKAETEKLRQALSAMEAEMKRGREERENDDRKETEEETKKTKEDRESEMIELNIQLKKQLAEVKAQLALEREERQREEEAWNQKINTERHVKTELNMKLEELEAKLEELKSCRIADSLEEEKLSVANSPLPYLTLRDDDLNSNITGWDNKLLPSSEQHLLFCQSTNQRNMLVSQATEDLIQEEQAVIDHEHSHLSDERQTRPVVTDLQDTTLHNYLGGSRDLQRGDSAPTDLTKEVEQLSKENVRETDRANQCEVKLKALQNQVTSQTKQLTMAFEKQSQHISGLLAELQEKESTLLSQGEELQLCKQELDALKAEKQGEVIAVKVEEDKEPKEERRERESQDDSVDSLEFQLNQDKKCAVTVTHMDCNAQKDAGKPEILTSEAEKQTLISSEVDNASNSLSQAQRQGFVNSEKIQSNDDSASVKKETECGQGGGIVAELLALQQENRLLKQRIDTLMVSGTNNLQALHTGSENQEDSVEHSQNTGHVTLSCSKEQKTPNVPSDIATEARPLLLNMSRNEDKGRGLERVDERTAGADKDADPASRLQINHLQQQVVVLQKKLRALSVETQRQTEELAVWRLSSQPAPTFEDILPNPENPSQTQDQISSQQHTNDMTPSLHQEPAPLGVPQSPGQVTVIREDELLLSCSSKKLQGRMLFSRLQHSNHSEPKSLHSSKKTSAHNTAEVDMESEKENQEISFLQRSDSCLAQHKEKRDTQLLQTLSEKTGQQHITKVSKSQIRPKTETPEAKRNASTAVNEIYTTSDSSERDFSVETRSVSSQTEESLYPRSPPTASELHCAYTQTEEEEKEGEDEELVESPPVSPVPLSEASEARDKILFSSTFPIPADPARLAERIRRNRTQLSAAYDDTEYEPYGLPEVVMKGFADIPTGPSCPYIVRRGLLGTAVVPVPQKEPGPEETD